MFLLGSECSTSGLVFLYLFVFLSPHPPPQTSLCSKARRLFFSSSSFSFNVLAHEKESAVRTTARSPATAGLTSTKRMGQSEG